MNRSLPRRVGRRASRLRLRHEPLERRICLSADTPALGAVSLDWGGRQVQARRDAWIVRTDAAAAAAIGVDPAWQGTGLGRGLLLAGLRLLAARGLTQAMLYVDAANTPAIGLYSSLGFTRWDTDVLYRRA